METTRCQVMDGWQPEAGNNVAISPGCVRCVAYVILRLIRELMQRGLMQCWMLFQLSSESFYTLCSDYFQLTNEDLVCI